MSTFEHKVEAVTDFLRNRASLNRLTDFQEVGRVTGELLARRGQRHYRGPVARNKIAEVLRAVDTNSLEDKGILLSALVVHFWDNKPGHRFFEQAIERGLFDEEADTVSPDPRQAFHAIELEKVFLAYPEYVEVNREVIVPDDIEDLDEEEYEDVD